MNTAVVINSGLGSLTMGIEKAGYQVIAAYETDPKARSVHERNINAPIFDRIPTREEYGAWEEPALLAARIHIKQPSGNALRSERPIQQEMQMLDIIDGCRPRAILFFVNPAGGKTLLPGFLDRINRIGYRLSYRLIDVGEALGLPIRERTLCIIGARNDNHAPLRFPDFDMSKQHYYPEDFLEIDHPIDSWYYEINPHHISYDALESGPYFCWSNGEYRPTDIIKWNTLRIPLVRDHNRPRRITHREIANIKAFPEYYNFSDVRNRSWLYKALMYSENITIVKQIAKGLVYNRPVSRGLLFENLFYRYLKSLLQSHSEYGLEVTREFPTSDYRIDFRVKTPQQLLLLELKLYTGRTVNPSRIQDACKQLSDLKAEGTIILTVANEVSDEMKAQCLDAYGIHIWDVGNLLWLFEDYPEIKTEFISFLDYSIDSIKAKAPAVGIVWDNSAKPEVEPDTEHDTNWAQKLSEIKPGTEHFRAYEDACVEILKYVLGDYLTLWKTQERSNDGLYRFDLCCRIKAGINQDFFDTIKKYFNTKYIVFEFKNTTEKIGQKEIYTTEKYLYEKALRKVAVIISREGADKHAMKAVKGSLRETGKLILCLSDEQLLEMIESKDKGEQEPADQLGDMLDDLLIHLEK
ncbi:hypothetical protein [uncultured Ruminococcus sp.]|uniref:hypothetical protein n=1 Tax=uncultured Ruminococcus sp. TaxID=165186 RepID=UPI00293040FE|nr:hypothetical protein [uncultured Ruminococcus sp.]